jgi:hypothetical protein
MTEHALPAKTPKESSTASNAPIPRKSEWSAPMALMLGLVVIGLPLLAWLTDLALLDTATTLARIEAIIRHAEGQQ